MLARDRGGESVCAGARGCAFTLALTLALAAPQASARALPEASRSQVEALYREAQIALEVGEYRRAGDRYREVLEVLDEGDETYETRALALADALRAYRRADEEGGDPRGLCLASAMASEYLREARAHFGIDAAVMDGPKTATREREAIEASLRARDLSCEELMKAPAPEPATTPEPEGTPATSEPAPGRPPRTRTRAPASDRGRTLRIAGGTGVGVGAVLLTTMSAGLLISAGAERDGRALREAAPGLDISGHNAAGFTRRGRLGDRLAIGSGIAAGATLIAGAVLLVVAPRVDRRASAATEARVVVDQAGVGVRF